MSDNVFTVDTIALLKAFSTVTGQRVEVLGYYAKGDGGGGLFHLDAADTTTVGNDGSVITPNVPSAGRWKAVERPINVKRWGAKGDGTTSDTARIQACINFVALNADGGEVYFPAGTYLVTTLNVSTVGIKFRGEGWKSSKLRSSSLTSKIVNVTGRSFELDGLNVGFNSIPTTTSGIGIYIAADDAKLTNFKIEVTGVGMWLENAYVAIINNFEMYTFSQAGFVFNHWIDAYVDNFALQASLGTDMGQLGCVYVTGGSEAIMLSNADILSGRHGLRTVGTTLGNSMNFCFFENLYFDSSFASPIRQDFGKMNKYTNVWCSGGRTAGAPAPGALIENSEGTAFVNSTFANNGASGCEVAATSTNSTFTECLFESNGYSTPPGNSHGLVFNPGTKKFRVNGCTAKSGLFSGVQGFGVAVHNGASDNYILTNNFWSNQGNSSGGLSDGGTGTFKVVGNNL